MTRLTGAAVAALLAAALLCPLARADADPASDILLGTSVFYPYTSSVSKALQRALNAEAAAAAKAHFPIKVALIDSPMDLGAIPSLFGKPRTYAAFLEQEIRFVAPHDALLVVMPDGLGVANVPRAAAVAASALPRPSGAQSDALAQVAVRAVERLAAATGHRITDVAEATSADGNDSTALDLAILAAAAIAISGAVLFARRVLSGSRSA